MSYTTDMDDAHLDVPAPTRAPDEHATEDKPAAAHTAYYVQNLRDALAAPVTQAERDTILAAIESTALAQGHLGYLAEAYDVVCPGLDASVQKAVAHHIVL